MQKRVLFVCIHNSARSQMAEAWLRHLDGQHFEAASAGLEPGKLNPLVVAAMREVGIDISHHQTKSVADKLRAGEQFDYVVTVCDESSAERCPTFPGTANRLRWSFADPSSLSGTDQEMLAETCRIRDEIRRHVEQFCGDVAADIRLRVE